MTKEATASSDVDTDDVSGFEEETEPGSKAEWFGHPETGKLRKTLSELRIRQTKELVRQGMNSSDPAIRGLAAQIWTLEAQVLSLGGPELIWPSKAERDAKQRAEREARARR